LPTTIHQTWFGRNTPKIVEKEFQRLLIRRGLELDSSNELKSIILSLHFFVTVPFYEAHQRFISSYTEKKKLAVPAKWKVANI
jgi:hypothetical protein